MTERDCEEWREDIIQRLSRVETRLELGPWLIMILLTIGGLVTWLVGILLKH